MAKGIKRKMTKADLTDSPDDLRHIEGEETTMDLPDVNDIPGQEHITPMPLGELADTTISSADEEGEGVEGLHDDEEISVDDDSNVSATERELLQRSAESTATPDDESLIRAEVDKTDDDGIPLNETSDQSGRDLDVPGSGDDDENEDIGEEDEENNPYSLPDDQDRD